MMKPCHLIVAFEKSCGIGKDGSIPWRLPSDMRHFREITTRTKDPEKKNAVIMGRKTYFSIPKSYRPLKERINVVLTRNFNNRIFEEIDVDNVVCKSLDQAIKRASENDNVESIFIIGGASVYGEAVREQKCEKLYITKVEKNIECDTYFCKDYEKWYMVEEEDEPITEKGITFQFITYKRK